jgi:hypothetical protein
MRYTSVYLYIITGIFFFVLFFWSFRQDKKINLLESISFFYVKFITILIVEVIWLVTSIFNYFQFKYIEIFSFLIVPPAIATLITISSISYFYIYKRFIGYIKYKNEGDYVLPIVKSWIEGISSSISLNSIHWNLEGKGNNKYGRIIIDIDLKGNKEIEWRTEVLKLREKLNFSVMIEIRNNKKMIYPK